jgi:hypothetical protein
VRSPFVIARSFGACGIPCSQPWYSPRASAASFSAASASKVARSRSEISAFTAPFTRSM